MGHLIKYRFIQSIRQYSIMFWALAFPLVLGTFFYMSFGSSDMGEDMETIPVAVVNVDTESLNGEAFSRFLESLDGDTIKIHRMNEEKALEQLKADEITGIYYAGQKPSLTVAGSEMNQSILKALMDSYNKNASMMENIAEKHPEKLPEALEAMQDWKETTREVTVGGRTTNPNISYFFALIAFTCLSGAYLGVQGSIDGQANLSALGARRSITPTNKMKIVLTDMIVLFTIHFIDVLILTGFVRFILGMDLGTSAGGILLVDLFGSVIGVSLGIMLGSVSRMAAGMKMGLCVAMTLFPSFLAGLMFGQMKDIIEHRAPIINRINPAAVLSDAFYCLGVYSDTGRFVKNLAILGGMSFVFVMIAFLAVRRERYDSI